MNVIESSYGGRYTPKSNSYSSNSVSKSSKPTTNTSNNISSKVNNTITNVTKSLTKLGDSISKVGDKIVSTTNQVKTQINDVTSKAKDKINQSTAAITNTVAKGISFTDGISVQKGPLTITTSSSVTQKVGNDKNGTVTANVDLSSGKTKVDAKNQKIGTNIDISDENIKVGLNGVTIPIVDNKYYSSELNMGELSISKKSAELTLIEHSIQTKPSSNNVTSELKTSVSINSDTIKKTAMVAAGVAIVVGSSYVIAQSVGLGYATVAPALAFGYSMAKTGATR